MRKNRLLIIGLFFCLIPLVSNSNVVFASSNDWVEWSQTYGGINDDGEFHLVYLIEVSDGGYIIAANTESFGAGGSDCWLIKVDSSGNMEWNQTYGGENGDRIYSLIQTSDGGFALAGRTRSFGAGASDCWFIKVDSLGNMEWNQTYGGEEADFVESIVQTSDGGFALGGTTESFASGWTDCWLIKTDNLGNMEWNKTYGGAETDWIHSLIISSDGGFAFFGETDSFGVGSRDFWLVKTDSNGNIEWSRTYGGEDLDFGHSLVETLDGGFVLAGNTKSFGAGGYDVWLIKTNSLGIPEFSSWLILPFFLFGTLSLIIFKRKMFSNRS